MPSNNREWFAYYNTDNDLVVRQYTGREDITKARASKSVREITGPFEAKGKDAAHDVALARLGNAK